VARATDKEPKDLWRQNATNEQGLGLARREERVVDACFMVDGGQGRPIPVLKDTYWRVCKGSRVVVWRSGEDLSAT
jgi:hypothetical protein